MVPLIALQQPGRQVVSLHVSGLPVGAVAWHARQQAAVGVVGQDPQGWLEA